MCIHGGRLNFIQIPKYITIPCRQRYRVQLILHSQQLACQHQISDTGQIVFPKTCIIQKQHVEKHLHVGYKVHAIKCHTVHFKWQFSWAKTQNLLLFCEIYLEAWHIP